MLHDAAGLADVRQLEQVGSTLHAISWLQHEASRQPSQVGSPELKPQPVLPLLVEVVAVVVPLTVVAGPWPVPDTKPPCPLPVDVDPVGPCVVLPPAPSPPKPPGPSLVVEHAAANAGIRTASERRWRPRMAGHETTPYRACPSRFRRAHEATLPVAGGARRWG